MAAYAEGLNILRHADVGMHRHTSDAETTPLRNPEEYRYAFDLPEVAELGGVAASSPPGCSTSPRMRCGGSPELTGFTGRRLRLRRGALDARGGHRRGRAAPVLGSALYQRFSSRGRGGLRRQAAVRHALPVRRSSEKGREAGESWARRTRMHSSSSAPPGTSRTSRSFPRSRPWWPEGCRCPSSAWPRRAGGWSGSASGRVRASRRTARGTKPPSSACASCCATWTGTTATRRRSPSWARRSVGRSARCTTWPSPRASSARWWRDWPAPSA